MRYAFSGCELDEDRRELVRDGRAVPLQARVLDLLLLLVRRRGEVVDRRVIEGELWRDTRVSPSALARLVLLARRAVGDSGREQRVIRTLRGRGLRFVAPLQVAGGDVAREAQRAVARARAELELAIESSLAELRACLAAFADACQATARLGPHADRHFDPVEDGWREE